MNLILLLYFLLIAILPLRDEKTASPPATTQAQAVNRTRIAFGSCNDQRHEQPLWQDIVAAKPDLWVWLGDNIYADTYDMNLMESYYEKQKNHPGYTLLRQSTPITGIWDDHDYSHDNSGKEFPYKRKSQQLFLDFMDVPKQAPIRKQEGIYRSYTLGESDEKIKILLLDVRYFRDKLLSFFGLYLPNLNGDILGEQQWEWLEQELTNSDAKVHLIASGLQILPTGKAYTNWSDYPLARKRLLQLLQKTQPAIPILLSGDRHVGELSKINLKGLPHPIYEITSSGMTHHRRATKKGNKYRVGEQVAALNFGILDIAWGDSATTITMQIRGIGNKVLLEKKVNF